MRLILRTIKCTIIKATSILWFFKIENNSIRCATTAIRWTITSTCSSSRMSWCNSKIRIVPHHSKPQTLPCFRDSIKTRYRRTVWEIASHHQSSHLLITKSHRTTYSRIKEVLSLHLDWPVNLSQGSNWTTCLNQLVRTANRPRHLNSSNSWLSLNTHHLMVLIRILSKWQETSQQFFLSSTTKCHPSLSSRMVRIKISLIRDRQVPEWVTRSFLDTVTK